MIRRQFVLFSVAGTVGFGVDVAVLYSLLALGAGFYAGRVLSFLVAAFVTWHINRRFAFAGREPLASAWSQWARYLSAMVVGALVNYGAYVAILQALAARWWVPMLGVAVGSVCGLAVNFLLARQWVFKSG